MDTFKHSSFLSADLLPSLGARINQSTKLRKHIISPFDPRFRGWEMWLVILVIYSAWICPFEFAFITYKKDALFIIDNIVNGFFAIDIILTFFVAYPPVTEPPMLPYNFNHLHHYPPNSYQLPHPLFHGGRYPILPPPTYVHQKAVTIRNDVNLKKKTLTLIPDPENPNRLLVSFTFDASMPGRITVVFFATEDAECNLRATKEDTLPPITFDFGEGLGQKFIQSSGTGIDLTAFKDSELFKEVDTDVFPLAVKAEATPAEEGKSGSTNVQITQVVYTKEKGEIKIEVVKQILWVNKRRYELLEIYGIENTVDGSDEGKECVVCLSEPRDTTVLPCRHMCMCSGCAKALRFQTNLCPVCRQPVEMLLEINKNG